MKKIPSLSFLEILIHHKVECVYDIQGHKIDIIRLMYDRFYDIYMQIKNGELFYNPIDLYE